MNNFLKKYMKLIRKYIKWFLLIAIFTSVGLWLYSCQVNKSKSISKKKVNIENVITKYNAIKDWNKHFDKEGYNLEIGHRYVYSDDIEKNLIRNDGKSIIVIGYIFEVKRKNNNFIIGIKYDGYPDLNFLLTSDENQAQIVLNQNTDEGRLFAVVSNIKRVYRPQFESDCYTFEDEEEGYYSRILVEPGDQYIILGNCLEIIYIGKSNLIEWE